MLQILCVEIGFIFLFLSFFSIFFGWRFRNFLSYLIALELLFLGLNLEFVLSSVFLDDIFGVVFVLFFLVIIAAEAAIAFSILISFYRLKDLSRFYFYKNKETDITFVFYEKLGYLYDFDVNSKVLWF